MIKKEAVNTMSDGIMLDLNPLQMSNTTLSNCLNGTLLTYNGDENVLLNDMGNARVETAMLPAGYIPLGTTSFGGIIYIVSLNPTTNECQIGSFPSPERNLMKDELKDDSACLIYLDNFCDKKGWLGDESTVITSYYLKTNLTDFKIYPNDKFKVFSPSLDGSISAWRQENTTHNPDNYPSILKLDIVSTLDDGKTVVLTYDSVWTGTSETDKNPFYIYNGMINNNDEENDLEEYRSLVKSNYDVYQNKTAGKLGIAATLEVPTSFSVGYDVLTSPSVKEPNTIYVLFYFYLNWTNIKKGEFKSEVNPSGIEVDINKSLDNFPILLPSSNGSKKYTIAPPEGYYNDDWNIVSYLKKCVNNFVENVPRKNDGSDFLYLLRGPKLKYHKDIKVFEKCTGDDEFFCYPIPDGIVNITVTPTMSFGKLKFLEQTLSINLDKLQTGEMSIDSYLYYVGNDDVNMTFNVEAYPELGSSVRGLDLEFYEFDANYKNQSIYDSEDFDKTTPSTSCVKKVSIDNTINGKQHLTFNKDNFRLNRVYIVKFILHYHKLSPLIDGTSVYKNEDRVFYRLFFNSSIFNPEFGSKNDFKDLKLYSPSLKGGIKPNFKFDLGIINEYANKKVNNENLEIPNEDNLPLYKTNIEVDHINHLYDINHQIDSTYNIESGLGNELELIINNVNITNTTISYDSDCNLIDAENIPKEVNISNGVYSLKNNFTIEIPYTIDYSDSEELNIYNKLSLVKDSNKIRLSHLSDEKHPGYLSLWYNKEWDQGDNGYWRALFVCPDNTTDIVCNTSDEFESKLLATLETNKSDYIVIIFGIETMGDDNKGYGYNIVSDHDSSPIYYYLVNHCSFYNVMNVIRRSDGSAAIIHGGNIAFKGTGTSEKVKDFDTIVNNTTYTKDLQVVKSTYKKYVKSGKIKTLFYIKDISNDLKSLSVNTKYTSKADISINKINLGNGTSITLTSSVANNFQIEQLENVDITANVVTSIDNKHVIINAQSRDSIAKGWYNNKIIMSDDLYKVYDDLDKVVPYMSLREKDNLLTFDDGALTKVKWFFGWENTTGSSYGQISKSDFDTSEQRYEFRYTYKVK